MRKHIHKTASTLVGERFKCVVNGKLSEAAKLNLFLWLVVWNIFHFSIYWESKSQLTFIFFSGVGQPVNHQPVLVGYPGAIVTRGFSPRPTPRISMSVVGDPASLGDVFDGASDGNLYRKDRKVNQLSQPGHMNMYNIMFFFFFFEHIRFFF